MNACTPALFSHGLLAHRRDLLARGALAGREEADQSAGELVCGHVAARKYPARRFVDLLERGVFDTKDGRVAVACSAILGARRVPPRAKDGVRARAWAPRLSGSSRGNRR